MTFSSKIVVAAFAALTFAGTTGAAFAGGDAAPRNKFVAPTNTGVVIVSTTTLGNGGKVINPPKNLVETQGWRRCTPASPC